MDVYAIMGCSGIPDWRHIAIIKSKFSENSTPISSPPEVTSLAEEGFGIVQYEEQNLRMD